MKKYRLLCILMCIICFTLSGCSKNATPVSKSGIYFDTVITITIYDMTQHDLLDKCFLLAEKYENLFSKTVEISDIYKINHSNGSPITVDNETIYLLEKAIFYAELTDGAIDPTILPLSDLWNFGENDHVPDQESILQALSHVGYENIIIDKENSTVTITDKNAGIDLGFIAKGYIADKMKEFLLSEGITSAIINLGGNVLTIGTKPDGTAYTLGIQAPFDMRFDPAPLTVDVKDKSLVTSGVYERYFYQEDVLYHHILSTETGYPVNNGLWSVTILSDSSMEGDAYSTICMCLGLDDALALIETTDNIEAMFITEDMEIIYSSDFPKN